MKKILTIAMLSFINFINRVGGLLRELIVAFYYGASKITDIFYITSNVPNTFYFILGNAFSTIIVPELNKINSKDEKNKIISFYFNVLMLISFLFTLIIFINSNSIVNFIAPGFDESQLINAKESLDLLIWSIPFLTGMMFITGILNSKNKFLIPGLSVSVLNFSFVFILLFNKNQLALNIAFLVSSLLAFLYCVILLKKEGFKYSFQIITEEIKSRLKNVLILILTFSINQISFFVLLYFATTINDGVVSAINYANKLIQLPIGIFSSAVMTIVFNSISNSLSIGTEQNKLGDEISNALFFLFIAVLPTTIFILDHSYLISSLAFNRGNFNSDALMYTSNALSILSIYIVTQSYYLVLTRIYFAYQKYSIPLITTSISTITFLAVALTGELSSLNSILQTFIISSLVNVILLLLFMKTINISSFILRKKYYLHSILLVLILVIDRFALSLIKINNDFLNLMLIFVIYIVIYAIYLLLTYKFMSKGEKHDKHTLRSAIR